MKNKILLLGLTIFGLLLIVWVSFYFLNQGKPETNSKENITEEVTGDLLENQSQSETEVTKNNSLIAPQLSNKLVTDDFEINIPEGWIKSEPVAGTVAMAVNTKESINDPAAQKINFKSYIAVSRDTLDAFQVKTLADYLQLTKEELLKAFPEAVFSNEKDVVINDQSARAMEIDLSQQDLAIKVLFLLIKGDGDDVWVVSFNTAKSAWDGYKEIFQNVANSFKLKI